MHAHARWLVVGMGMVLAVLRGWGTPTNFWTGAASTNWSDAANWTLGRIPEAGDDVVVVYPTKMDQAAVVQVGAIADSRATVRE